MSWYRCTSVVVLALCLRAQRITNASFTSRHSEFFPDGPEKSESFGRIVTMSHVERIARLIKETQGEIVVGGEIDKENKYIAPTIINNVSRDEPLMQESVPFFPFASEHKCRRASLIREIFGPVLPIVGVKDVEEAIAFVNTRYVTICSRTAWYLIIAYTQGSSSRSLCVLQRCEVQSERCGSRYFSLPATDARIHSCR